jgi:hypothetical protein
MTIESQHYDPRSLSYGLGDDDLIFDSVTMDEAPDLSWVELMDEILNQDYRRELHMSVDPDSRDRTMDMALALFANIIDDDAYDGLSRLELWGACLLQAEIWERG